jgi:hypothetical protein
MAGTTASLLPGGGDRGRASRLRIGLAFAASAVLCALYVSLQPVPTELTQFDHYVERQRKAWDRLDAGVVSALPVRRRGLASFSELAQEGVSFTDFHVGRNGMRTARAASDPRAAVGNEWNAARVKTEWAAIDRAVDGRLSRSEAGALQQLADAKKDKKGKKDAKKEEKKVEKKAKKDGKKKEKEEKKEEKKDEKEKSKGKKGVLTNGGSFADASIHNTGFYLSANSIDQGSNVIIYGTGEKMLLIATEILGRLCLFERLPIFHTYISYACIAFPVRLCSQVPKFLTKEEVSPTAVVVDPKAAKAAASTALCKGAGAGGEAKDERICSVSCLGTLQAVLPIMLTFGYHLRAKYVPEHIFVLPGCLIVSPHVSIFSILIRIYCVRWLLWSLVVTSKRCGEDVKSYQTPGHGHFRSSTSSDISQILKKDSLACDCFASRSKIVD